MRSFRSKPKPQAQVIDPDVEKLSALIVKSGLTDNQIANKIGGLRHAPMSPETVKRIRELETGRPQNFTMLWIGCALGYQRIWRKIG